MATLVEVKLRFSNEIMKWEERSIHTTFEVIPGNGPDRTNIWVTAEPLFVGKTRIPLSEKVAQIREAAGAVESRWNFKGSDQGHYTFA